MRGLKPFFELRNRERGCDGGYNCHLKLKKNAPDLGASAWVIILPRLWCLILPGVGSWGNKTLPVVYDVSGQNLFFCFLWFVQDIFLGSIVTCRLRGRPIAPRFRFASVAWFPPETLSTPAAPDLVCMTCTLGPARHNLLLSFIPRASIAGGWHAPCHPSHALIFIYFSSPPLLFC